MSKPSKKTLIPKRRSKKASRPHTRTSSDFNAPFDCPESILKTVEVPESHLNSYAKKNHKRTKTFHKNLDDFSLGSIEGQAVHVGEKFYPN